MYQSANCANSIHLNPLYKWETSQDLFLVCQFTTVAIKVTGISEKSKFGEAKEKSLFFQIRNNEINSLLKTNKKIFYVEITIPLYIFLLILITAEKLSLLLKPIWTFWLERYFTISSPIILIKPLYLAIKCIKAFQSNKNYERQICSKYHYILKTK